MPREAANVQLVDDRAVQTRHNRRFRWQKLSGCRDYCTNRIPRGFHTANCFPSAPDGVAHSSSPRVDELFAAIYPPGIMCTGGQVFDKNVPEEIAPICVSIEDNNVNRFRAFCRIIKQQFDPVRISTEDREVDSLRRPACSGQKSGTRPCQVCFQSIREQANISSWTVLVYCPKVLW